MAPRAVPTLYVDDLSVEASGGDMHVVRHVASFTLSFCRSVEDALMSISRTKSLCSASSPSLGRRLAAALQSYGVQLRDRVTSLGSALGAGRRRNAKVLQARLKAFKQRLPRFRKLVNAKACSKVLLRTGGIAALTFGQAVTGVSNHTLLQQRRAAAAAAAPRSGAAGQDLDLALVLADGGPRGRADPAFEAHTQPIVTWAEAVWHRWPRRRPCKASSAASWRS